MAKVYIIAEMDYDIYNVVGVFTDSQKKRAERYVGRSGRFGGSVTIEEAILNPTDAEVETALLGFYFPDDE